MGAINQTSTPSQSFFTCRSMSSQTSAWKVCTAEDINNILLSLQKGDFAIEIGKFVDDSSSRDQSASSPIDTPTVAMEVESDPREPEDDFVAPQQEGNSFEDRVETCHVESQSPQLVDECLISFKQYDTQALQLHTQNKSSTNKDISPNVDISQTNVLFTRKSNNMVKNILRAFRRFVSSLNEDQIQAILKEQQLQSNSVSIRSPIRGKKSQDYSKQNSFQVTFDQNVRLCVSIKEVQRLCLDDSFRRVFLYWLVRIADYWIFNNSNIKEEWNTIHRCACQEVISYLRQGGKGSRLLLTMKRLLQWVPQLGVPEKPEELFEARDEGQGEMSFSDLVFIGHVPNFAPDFLVTDLLDDRDPMYY